MLTALNALYITQDSGMNLSRKNTPTQVMNINNGREGEGREEEGGKGGGGGEGGGGREGGRGRGGRRREGRGGGGGGGGEAPISQKNRFELKISKHLLFNHKLAIHTSCPYNKQ